MRTPHQVPMVAVNAFWAIWPAEFPAPHDSWVSLTAAVRRGHAFALTGLTGPGDHEGLNLVLKGHDVAKALIAEYLRTIDRGEDAELLELLWGGHQAGTASVSAMDWNHSVPNGLSLKVDVAMEREGLADAMMVVPTLTWGGRLVISDETQVGTGHLEVGPDDYCVTIDLDNALWVGLLPEVIGAERQVIADTVRLEVNNELVRALLICCGREFLGDILLDPATAPDETTTHPSANSQVLTIEDLVDAILELSEPDLTVSHLEYLTARVALLVQELSGDVRQAMRHRYLFDSRLFNSSFGTPLPTVNILSLPGLEDPEEIVRPLWELGDGINALQSEFHEWKHKVRQVRRRWLRASLLLVDPSLENATTTELDLNERGLR